MKNLTYILLITLLISCGSEDEIYKRTTTSMGTIVEIQIKDIAKGKAKTTVDEVFKEFNRLDEKYSTYKTNNWMWKVNNTDQDTILLDEESSYLVMKSDELYKATQGGFDPAIGKLIDLLGFEKGSPDVPSQDEVKKALEKVGWKNIEIENKNELIKDPGISINFGGIVKGYAVDRAAEIIEENGINNYLVNAGGEIRAKGNDWEIGIQHPREKDELLGVLNPDGLGVATSGDYEQYFEKEGKRYNHIINPLSGLPATETMAVTVIAEDVTTADGLATGVFVVGPEKGMQIIEKIGNAEALIVDSSGTISYSSGFEKYFRR